MTALELGKLAAAPYGGMATPPILQPLGQNAQPGQVMQGQLPAATPTGMPGMAAPSPSAQVAGPGRQARGYGNTPLKQNSGAAGTPGRPPVGTKKSSVRRNKKANSACPPVTGLMTGVGRVNVGSPMPSLVPGNLPSAGSVPVNKSAADSNLLPTPPDAATAGLAAALSGGIGGATLGAPLGVAAGAARGNAAEGLGRGIVRGGMTGAGASLGTLLGALAGERHSPGAATAAGLGGALAGGIGGYALGGKLLGKPVGSGKKEKDKTDQEKK
jgi:hypothetical protein